MTIEDQGSKKSKIPLNARQMVGFRKNPIEENYEILETIGKGGFGEVRKVRHKQLDIIRALKIVKKSRYRTS